jgi:hypothetical protein
MNNTQHTFFISLKKKKPDLKNLRQEKLRGCYIRSKMQWAEEGKNKFPQIIAEKFKEFTIKTI